MKLDEALRCLLLRNLRERQTEALARGQKSLAGTLSCLAERLRVTRDRENGTYLLAIEGGKEWRVPESEFSFYTRGDRPQDPHPPAFLSDEAFENNLKHAHHWVDTMIRSHEPT